MRINIHYKITIVFCVILAVVFTGIFLYLDSSLKENTFRRIKSALLKETLLVKLFLEKDFPGYPRLKEIDAIVDETGDALDSRVTIISLNGKVLGDSELDGERLEEVENHLYRPEVQQAIKQGTGESVRFSTTVQKNMLYIATTFGQDGPEGIVRLSLSLADIEMVSNNLKRILLIAVLFAFLLTAAASYVASGLISKPLEEMSSVATQIARGDFSKRITVSTNDEIGDLAKAFTHMTEQIKLRIDEITKSRSRFEAVLLSMFDGVMVVDSKGAVILMNPTLMDSLSVLGDPSGKKPMEVLRNIDVQDMTDKVLSKNKEAESREITVFAPEEHIYVVHATPIIREGQTEGAVLVFHDISELRKLEKVRRDFVANVSHELRTPVSNIKGYTETLLDGALKDEKHSEEFVGIIKSNSERLASLIDDLLDLSQLESGKLDLHLLPCSVKSVIEKTCKEAKKKAEAKSISIKLKVPVSLPEIMADENLLTQALFNLLDNAIKYTEEKGAVTISAAEEGESVRVSVADNGTGIPEKALPRIFERFYRVDKARSRDLGGTGLGLSIVKHIIQEHGGEVSVESQVGQGSIFSFTVPKA